MSAFFGVKYVVSIHKSRVAVWALWICLQAARLALRKQILAVAVARKRAFGI